MSRRLRRIAKLAAALLALMLIAAACSSDGLPESYADQVDAETGLSNVQANWLEGCEVGFADSDLAEEANSICACGYDSLSSDVAEGGIEFAAFIQLNNDLKGNPAGLAERAKNGGLSPIETQLLEIVKGCIAG